MTQSADSMSDPSDPCSMDESFLQVNIYGIKMIDLKKKGIDVIGVLNNLGLPDCVLFEVPISGNQNGRAFSRAAKGLRRAVRGRDFSSSSGTDDFEIKEEILDDEELEKGIAESSDLANRNNHFVPNGVEGGSRIFHESELLMNCSISTIHPCDDIEETEGIRGLSPFSNVGLSRRLSFESGELEDDYPPLRTILLDSGTNLNDAEPVRLCEEASPLESNACCATSPRHNAEDICMSTNVDSIRPVGHDNENVVDSNGCEEAISNSVMEILENCLCRVSDKQPSIASLPIESFIFEGEEFFDCSIGEFDIDVFNQNLSMSKELLEKSNTSGTVIHETAGCSTKKSLSAPVRELSGSESAVEPAASARNSVEAEEVTPIESTSFPSASEFAANVLSQNSYHSIDEPSPEAEIQQERVDSDEFEGSRLAITNNVPIDENCPNQSLTPSPLKRGFFYGGVHFNESFRSVISHPSLIIEDPSSGTEQPENLPENELTGGNLDDGSFRDEGRQAEAEDDLFSRESSVDNIEEAGCSGIGEAHENGLESGAGDDVFSREPSVDNSGRSEINENEGKDLELVENTVINQIADQSVVLGDKSSSNDERVEREGETLDESFQSFSDDMKQSFDEGDLNESMMSDLSTPRRSERKRNPAPLSTYVFKRKRRCTRRAALREYTCHFENCGVTFHVRPRYGGQERLLNHVRLHAKREAQKCRLCEYTASVASRVRRHHQLKHPKSLWKGVENRERREDMEELLRLRNTCFPGWVENEVGNVKEES